LEVNDGANEFGFHPSLPDHYRLQYFETVSFAFFVFKSKFTFGSKLIEAMAPFFFSTFSASLCQDIPSLPSWYRFNKQEL
jgi:hypothetical protein